jgi:hypothetical protein
MESGTRDSPLQTEGPVGAFIRLVGFATLAGMALAILAGVVLLPAYAGLQQTRYQQACLAVRTEEARRTIRAYDRLIEAADKDPVLLQRLARSHLGAMPQDEYVVLDPDAPAASPAVVRPVQLPDPAAPDGWLIRMAGRLEDRPFRRGVLVLAVAAMATALFLFGPPASSRDALSA